MPFPHEGNLWLNFGNGTLGKEDFLSQLTGHMNVDRVPVAQALDIEDEAKKLIEFAEFKFRDKLKDC